MIKQFDNIANIIDSTHSVIALSCNDRYFELKKSKWHSIA